MWWLYLVLWIFSCIFAIVIDEKRKEAKEKNNILHV